MLFFWKKVFFQNFLSVLKKFSKRKKNAGAKRGRRPSGARNWVGKKKRVHRLDDSTTNFVSGQTYHFLVEVFSFLSLFQPPKTFSYVFHFHNLSKRHFESKSAKQFSNKSFSEKKKQFSNKSFSEKKKKLKKLFICFSIFFSLSKTYSTPFSCYFIVIHLLPTKKKGSKKRFARPVHFNTVDCIYIFFSG